MTLLILRILRVSCCPHHSIPIPTGPTASATTPTPPFMLWRTLDLLVGEQSYSHQQRTQAFARSFEGAPWGGRYAVLLQLVRHGGGVYPL